MDRSAKFWDRFAERYARRPVADEAAYRKKLEMTRGYLRPDMEVLEFGCGTGSTAIAQAPYIKHIRAIDSSAKMLEIARRKADAAGVANVKFEQSTIEEFTAPDASLDAIMGHSILHLVADRPAVVAKVYRLLKPGGVFITSTTCLSDTMNWFRIVAPVGVFFGVFPLITFFTADELLDGFTDAGFEIAKQWSPGKGKAMFVVARKPDAEP